ncbi:hypothetical protein [Mariniluteicoccus flavus]
MRAVLDVFVRTLVLAAGSFAAGWLATLGDRSGGAALGAGLAGFAALIVMSGVWGALDGHRAGKLGRPLAVWLVTAIVVGVIAAVQAQAFAPRIDPQVLASDLSGVTPLVAGLVLVPAAIGAAIGVVVGRRRRSVDAP